jgi:hypothetical protein
VFAIGGETEMPRLDDAGMYGPDRDLMQAFASAGKTIVSLSAVIPGAPGACPESISPGLRVRIPDPPLSRPGMTADNGWFHTP